MFGNKIYLVKTSKNCTIFISTVYFWEVNWATRLLFIKQLHRWFTASWLDLNSLVLASCAGCAGNCGMVGSVCLALIELVVVFLCCIWPHCMLYLFIYFWEKSWLLVVLVVLELGMVGNDHVVYLSFMHLCMLCILCIWGCTVVLVVRELGTVERWVMIMFRPDHRSFSTSTCCLCQTMP